MGDAPGLRARAGAGVRAPREGNHAQKSLRTASLKRGFVVPWEQRSRRVGAASPRRDSKLACGLHVAWSLRRGTLMVRSRVAFQRFGACLWLATNVCSLLACQRSSDLSSGSAESRGRASEASGIVRQAYTETVSSLSWEDPAGVPVCDGKKGTQVPTGGTSSARSFAPPSAGAPVTSLSVAATLTFQDLLPSEVPKVAVLVNGEPLGELTAILNTQAGRNCQEVTARMSVTTTQGSLEGFLPVNQLSFANLSGKSVRILSAQVEFKGPSVTGLAPTQGQLAGGTLLTIAGTDMPSSGLGGAGTTSVLVGGKSASNVEWIDDKTLRAVTPAGADLGNVPVQVQFAQGSTMLVPGGFSYGQNPTQVTVVTAATGGVPFGMPVPLEATVQTPGTLASLEGNEVEFFVDGTVAGTAKVSAGKAAFQAAELGLGAHAVFAKYNGDPHNAPSPNSDVLSVTMVSAKTDTFVIVPPKAVVAAPVELKAQVTVRDQPGVVPTGMVRFLEGNVVLGEGALNGEGQAAVSVSNLPLGSHVVAALFQSSSGNYVSSVSSGATVVVEKDGSVVTLESSKSPVVYGEAFTLTALVGSVASSSVPKGTVTFFDGPLPKMSPGIGPDGKASFLVAPNAVLGGKHTFRAVYGGDDSHKAGSEGVLELEVLAAPTQIALEVLPAVPVTGETVTLAATVTSSAPGDPEGTVSFAIGTGFKVDGLPLVNGVATVQTTASAVGNQTVTASYTGDGNFEGAVAPPLALTVEPALTTTELITSLTPAQAGTDIELTARVVPVKPGAGTVEGSLRLEDESELVGTFPLVKGSVTVPRSWVTVGTRTIKATYVPPVVGAKYIESSATLAQVVSLGGVSIGLVSKVPEVPAVGANVRWTVSVTGNPALPKPTGTLSFLEGTRTIVGIDLLGQNTLGVTTSFAQGDRHTILVHYSGDANYASADSMFYQDVLPAPTSVTLEPAATSITYGDALTLTAIVQTPSGDSPPVGDVEFYEGSNVLGKVKVGTGWRAVWTSPSNEPMGGGLREFRAKYLGDDLTPKSFAPSPLSPLAQVTVRKAPTTVSVEVAPKPVAVGKLVTFTATVHSSVSMGAKPSGDLTFFVDDETLDGVLDGQGQGNASTSNLGIQTHQVLAKYNGDGNFEAMDSDVVEFVVTARMPSVKLTVNPSPSVFGAEITGTATVTDDEGQPMETGKVDFFEGEGSILETRDLEGGAATFSWPRLAVGSHALKARFVGNAMYAAVTDTWMLEVTRAPTQVLLESSANPSLVGVPVTFSATVSCTVTGEALGGQVQFLDGNVVLDTVDVGNDGKAVFTPSELTVGTHAIVAVYTGTPSFEGGTANLVQTVQLTQKAPDEGEPLRDTDAGTSAVDAGAGAGGGMAVVDRGSLKGGGCAIGVGGPRRGGHSFGSGLLAGSVLAALTAMSGRRRRRGADASPPDDGT